MHSTRSLELALLNGMQPFRLLLATLAFHWSNCLDSDMTVYVQEPNMLITNLWGEYAFSLTS